MTRIRLWLALAVLLAIAMFLRLNGLDWDSYNHYQPDERYISWVATTIEWPDRWSTAFDLHQSSFNPFYWPPDAASAGIEVLRDEQRDFAYGHLPLYLGVIATRFVEQVAPLLAPILPSSWKLAGDLLNTGNAVEFRHLTAVSRALTAVFDGATIIILFLMGRRLFSAVAGLLAAALLAVNVMHIQLSHYFAADPYLSFFVLAALYFMLRGLDSDPEQAQASGWQKIRRLTTFNLLLAAVFMGLAVGSKFSAIMLAFPLSATVLLSSEGRKWLLLAGALILSLLTFAITNPFAMLDYSCPPPPIGIPILPAVLEGPILRSCYLQNVVTQGAMVRGVTDLGFTRQYAGTIPYLYFIEMQIRWGMGWLLGVTAFVAFAWAIGRGGRTVWQWTTAQRRHIPFAWSRGQKGLLVLLAWSVPFFLVTGSFYVKFMRYLMPLTPLLMLFAAAMIMQWKSRLGRTLLAGAVLATSAIYAFSFNSIYQVDHPWVAASRWVFENVPPGALMASEQWDDTLPTTMIVDGRARTRREYENHQLTWLTYPDQRDTAERLEANLQILARADYVTLLSNRVYGVVPRSNGRFPVSGQYHQLLFDGALGYEPVYAQTRAPNLFGLYFLPDPFVWPELAPPDGITGYLDSFGGVNGGRFDESFTVYDQPLVMIFENTGNYSADQMRSRFELELAQGGGG